VSRRFFITISEGEHAGSTRPVLATGDAGVVKDTIAAIVRRLGVSPRPLQREVVVPLRPAPPEEREPWTASP
jgi:hypothetical protein